MTGMDVLRQCSRYSEDIGRLKLKRSVALDAATRITGGTSGGGHSGETSDKVGAYAYKAKEIELATQARKSMYALELICAGELVGGLNLNAGAVMHARMVKGLTVRQTAAELHMSESSVRGLYARARAELDDRTAWLGTNAEYRRAAAAYVENGGTMPERFVKRISAGEPL